MATERQIIRAVRWASSASPRWRETAREAAMAGFRSAWLPLDKNIGRRLEKQLQQEARRRR